MWFEWKENQVKFLLPHGGRRKRNVANKWFFYRDIMPEIRSPVGMKKNKIQQKIKVNVFILTKLI